MASETEAAAGNTTINYEVASTAVETPVVVVVAPAPDAAAAPEAGNSGSGSGGAGVEVSSSKMAVSIATATATVSVAMTTTAGETAGVVAKTTTAAAVVAAAAAAALGKCMLLQLWTDSTLCRVGSGLRPPQVKPLYSEGMIVSTLLIPEQPRMNISDRQSFAALLVLSLY